jgi:hypothetical protein
MATGKGHKDVTEVLLEAGASLSREGKLVIKSSKILIRHLKGLIFDCLSFTEGLITCFFTLDSEDPVSSDT